MTNQTKLNRWEVVDWDDGDEPRYHGGSHSEAGGAGVRIVIKSFTTIAIKSFTTGSICDNQIIN